MAKSSLGQLQWLTSASLVHPHLPPYPGEFGEVLGCQPPPLRRSHGPSLSAVDPEARDGVWVPVSRLWGERRSMKAADPALYRVQWGRQGLDPRHLLARPPATLPAGTGTLSCTGLR